MGTQGHDVVTIKARLSDEFATHAYLERGEITDREISWTIPHAELPRDVREYMVERFGGPPSGSICFRLSTYRPENLVLEDKPWRTKPDADPIAELRADRERYEAALRREEAEKWIARAKRWTECLERDQGECLGLEWSDPVWRTGSEITDRPTALPRQWVTWVQDHPDLRETLLTVDSLLVAAHTAFQQRVDARRRAERDAEEARKQRQQETMRHWIGEHGSDVLRRMIDAGYSSAQQYLSERIAAEYPGFLNVNPDRGDCAWGACDSPSAEALDLAQQYGGRVVNVTLWNGRSGDGEAVVVEPDWWDVTLVHLIRFDETWD